MRNKQQYMFLHDQCEHCIELQTILKFLNKPFIFKTDFSENICQEIPDCIIFCEHLTEHEGMLTALKYLKLKQPQLQLLVLGQTDKNEIKTIIDNFVSTPITQNQLRQILNQLPTFETQQKEKSLLNKLIGQSQKMQDLRDIIQQVAQSDSSVLILGESGTGKELVASNIHYLSNRHKKPFVPVNCGAIPGELMESELFGHEKGAFTGAISRRQGRFELANNGTLFLDEIGDMPLAMQVKLLRVLQEQCFERIGSNTSINTDVRIIAATHRDLELAIQQKTFREDLFYRLNVFPLFLPPLRDRTEDIPLLISHFLGQTPELNQQSFDESAMKELMHYPWPGNVRELANLCEQMQVLYPNAKIMRHHLPKKYMVSHAENNIPDKKTTKITLSPNFSANGMGLKECLLETELNLIMQALDECNGNVTTTAKYLSVGRTTLIEKMRKHGLRYSNQKNVNDELAET